MVIVHKQMTMNVVERITDLQRVKIKFGGVQ